MNRTVGIFILLLTLGTLAFAQDTGGASPSAVANKVATAQLVGRNGNVIGDVNFTEPAEGENRFVTIQVGIEQAAGLEPGDYGFHIHETGRCDAPDFESAGGHFNPTNASHGLLDPEGPHAGDLINLHVGEDGSVTYVVSTALVTLSEGERAIFDTDGSAVILHAQPDDYVTDPGGGSGDRIACGVIEQE